MNRWIQGARLRTLPLSLSGIIVGTGIASSKGFFDPIIFGLALLTTILFQIISNYANDLGDAQKGTDLGREGEKRMVQSGEITSQEMTFAIILISILSFISATILLVYSFLPNYTSSFFVFIGLAILSICAALLYTLGNKPYGYFALGDVFVFLFFGILSVLGSEFLYTKTMDAWSLLPASAIGFFSVAVLNLNNMRDFDNDKKNGKRTFAIVLGKKKAKYYELFLLNIPFFLGLIYVLKLYPNKFAPLLFMLLIFPAMGIRRKIIFTTFDKDYDPFLKQVALLCFVFSIVFAIGISGILDF